MIWNMAPVLREEDEKNENIPKMLCQMDNHLGNQAFLSARFWLQSCCGRFWFWCRIINVLDLIEQGLSLNQGFYKLLFSDDPCSL